MRLLVCDDHVLFAESLAHLLGTRGRPVTAVAHHLDGALAALAGGDIELALMDVGFGAGSVFDRFAELRAVAGGTRFVLLSGRVDDEVLAAARERGVHAVADKRQPIAEIVAILDRVHRGERLLPAHTPGPRSTRIPAGSHAAWLAGFLTPRERQVLSGLVRGSGTATLARSLGIAEATARCHVQAVLTKMGAHSRLEAATTAVRCGMVDPRSGRWLAEVGSGR